MSLALTHAVPPEVPQTAVVSSSQDVDISVVAAAGVLVAVTWRRAALRELSPQAGTLTHSWHRPLSLDHFLEEAKSGYLEKLQNILQCGMFQSTFTTLIYSYTDISKCKNNLNAC